jgi:hypothetical protein
MRSLRAWLTATLLGILATGTAALAQNQTPTVSPIASGAGLPFRVAIDLAGFSLPSGIHSYVMGSANGKWLFLAGRTKLERLGPNPVVVGYVVGGIQSALPNTNGPSDSGASPFIFTVTLTRQ